MKRTKIVWVLLMAAGLFLFTGCQESQKASGKQQNVCTEKTALYEYLGGIPQECY